MQLLLDAGASASCTNSRTEDLLQAGLSIIRYSASLGTSFLAFLADDSIGCSLRTVMAGLLAAAQCGALPSPATALCISRYLVLS